MEPGQHGNRMLHVSLDKRPADKSFNHSEDSPRGTAGAETSDFDSAAETSSEKWGAYRSTAIKVKNSFIEFLENGEMCEEKFPRQHSAPARLFHIQQDWHEGERLPADGDKQQNVSRQQKSNAVRQQPLLGDLCSLGQRDAARTHGYPNQVQACAFVDAGQNEQPQAGMGNMKGTSCYNNSDAHVPSRTNSEVDRAGTSTSSMEVTLIIINCDRNCTPQGLARVLDDSGHRGHYDFVAVPTDLPSGAKRGYGIINFVDGSYAKAFIRTHEKLCRTLLPYSSPNSMTSVVPATVNGFRDLYRKYAMSPEGKVLPAEFRPLLKRDLTPSELQAIFAEGNPQQQPSAPAAPRNFPQSAGALSGQCEPSQRKFCGWCGHPRFAAPAARLCMKCGHPIGG